MWHTWSVEVWSHIPTDPSSCALVSLHKTPSSAFRAWRTGRSTASPKKTVLVWKELVGATEVSVVYRREKRGTETNHHKLGLERCTATPRVALRVVEFRHIASVRAQWCRYEMSQRHKTRGIAGALISASALGLLSTPGVARVACNMVK